MSGFLKTVNVPGLYRNIGLWHKTIVGMVGKDVCDYGNCVILIYLQYIEPQKRADMFSLGTKEAKQDQPRQVSTTW